MSLHNPKSSHTLLPDQSNRLTVAQQVRNQHLERHSALPALTLHLLQLLGQWGTVCSPLQPQDQPCSRCAAQLASPAEMMLVLATYTRNITQKTGCTAMQVRNIPHRSISEHCRATSLRSSRRNLSSCEPLSAEPAAMQYTQWPSMGAQVLTESLAFWLVFGFRRAICNAQQHL